ncbi:MAG: hypothetical protein N3I86_09805 [Verrucomicrobiae bacterium]|nr:hypothetical protein [Verrucomicrobiae bacterium]
MSDNFDSYSNTTQFRAAGWILSAINPALVTTTFPAVGSGKGVRLQANPVPGAAPAVGVWYRTNEYTDFYVAIDIVDWPGTDKNQAFVLFARMTDNTTGTVTTNMLPQNARGVICNYDASQYGELPGNRRQGQFQINVVNAGFSTITLAISEVTFQPGRSYRIIFKGVGTALVAEAYDMFDLTRPLVRLEADDISGFTSGACGFVGYSRQGTTGTVDVTYDNYYSGPSDPNVAPAPALAHPEPGTPQVVTRTPSRRYTNFHPVSSGISFNAQIFGGGTINASATKLYLNGVDASSALAPFPPNGTNINFSTAPGTLLPNTVYAARIELVDTTGTRRGTNTFWFDTFTDAFLETAPVKTIECEDYNYSNGQYQLDPIPVSGYNTNGAPINGGGIGYWDLGGVDGVDFDDFRTTPEFPFFEYRQFDLVGTVQGQPEVQDKNFPTVPDGNNFDNGLRGNDNTRQKYAIHSMREYQVNRTEVGEWLNYTRVFPDTNYLVYLRVSSFGATAVTLEQVTSDPTLPNQTTNTLGVFNIPNQLRRDNYHYVPLRKSDGTPAVLNLAGTNTVRLTMRGTVGEDTRKIYLNYLLFVPWMPYPTPSLNIAPGPGGSVQLSWPLGAYALEASPSLTTPTWTRISSGISQIGTEYVYTVPPSGDMRFFRLVYP